MPGELLRFCYIYFTPFLIVDLLIECCKVSFFLVTLGHCFAIRRKWPAAFWLEIELNLYLLQLVE